MTTAEQIHKARHDVDTLQHGLDRVEAVLRNAEEVAVLGEEARRRAPLVLLSLAGALALTVGVVYLVRRRRHATDETERTY
jgi:predicted ABC-type transport system involved in lysophospholipase L1 biosynthesis ATPase subunit